MRRLWIMIVFVPLLFWSCAGTHPHVMITGENIIPPREEKTEYDIDILDPGFNTWFLTQWNQAEDRSYRFYDTWNDRYVQAWNFKATNPRYGGFFNTIINYDINEDYGMEVSRKLYYYFSYVEDELKIPILN
jgi:hypothetical protein